MGAVARFFHEIRIVRHPPMVHEEDGRGWEGKLAEPETTGESLGFGKSPKPPRLEDRFSAEVVAKIRKKQKR